MDSNISFLLFAFWGLISNFQLEITFICSLSLFTFTKECNLLSRICYFLSLLVCSYFKIKLGHFQYWNYIWFWGSRPWIILQTHCFVWYFLSQYIFFIKLYYWHLQFLYWTFPFSSSSSTQFVRRQLSGWNSSKCNLQRFYSFKKNKEINYTCGNNIIYPALRCNSLTPSLFWLSVQSFSLY